MSAAKVKPKRAAKVYKMPEKFAKGERLVDAKKVEWILKDSIGTGGFGEIYGGAKASDPSKVRYAIKIEPHENGPLFCERTVYLNLGPESDMEEFRKAKKIKYLGLPRFHGFGSHRYKGKEYRFIVIDKLGKDVWSLYQLQNSMPYDTAIKIAHQIVFVLEYMHSKGYVHCDIKGANLLLGDEKKTEHQVNVVDFGLACRFSAKDTPNPKKAHNGTIEYTSRDAHRGVMTRRGDMEILGYNLLHWTSGRLPWLPETNPTKVQDLKEKAMGNTDKLLKDCYKTETPHSAVKDFLSCVARLQPLEDPNYERLAEILDKEVKKLKSDPNKLVFAAKKSPPAKKQKLQPEPETPEKNGRPIRNGTKKKYYVSESESEDETSPGSDEDIFVSKPKAKRKAMAPVSSNGDVASSPKTPRTKKPEVKRSWRDCPTVVNGASRHGD